MGVVTARHPVKMVGRG